MRAIVAHRSRAAQAYGLVAVRSVTTEERAMPDPPYPQVNKGLRGVPSRQCEPWSMPCTFVLFDISTNGKDLLCGPSPSETAPPVWLGSP
ncbi:hypothetical protein J2853_001909 [Streptosporangium lutulentum]|uniref:Uncharacterized protein n=1 Tax=Streptosporangium lutulentum TaxID=1461250 RepID=A0ABT9Q7I6_9ACTN|nr:hypothetical protein [Streptosporangium lutulentum]